MSKIYSKEIPLGDILYNKDTKTVLARISLGVFSKDVTLVKNNDGTYDMYGTYFKNGEVMSYKMGKTFPAKRNDGSVVEGITKATFGLESFYDKELGKIIASNNNMALYITTHKLKEEKQINDKLVKVGWITGEIGIVPRDGFQGEGETSSQNNGGSDAPTKQKPAKEKAPEPEEDEIPEIDIDEDEVPF